MHRRSPPLFETRLALGAPAPRRRCPMVNPKSQRAVTHDGAGFAQHQLGLLPRHDRESVVFVSIAKLTTIGLALLDKVTMRIESLLKS